MYDIHLTQFVTGSKDVFKFKNLDVFQLSTQLSIEYYLFQGFIRSPNCITFHYHDQHQPPHANRFESVGRLSWRMSCEEGAPRSLTIACKVENSSSQCSRNGDIPMHSHFVKWPGSFMGVWRFIRRLAVFYISIHRTSFFQSDTELTIWMLNQTYHRCYVLHRARWWARCFKRWHSSWGARWSIDTYHFQPINDQISVLFIHQPYKSPTSWMRYSVGS